MTELTEDDIECYADTIVINVRGISEQLKQQILQALQLEKKVREKIKELREFYGYSISSPLSDDIFEVKFANELQKLLGEENHG